MCVYATAGAIIRILVWSGKCHSKQEVGWSSADIDQLFYITCTLEVRSYVNSTSNATNSHEKLLSHNVKGLPQCKVHGSVPSLHFLV